MQSLNNKVGRGNNTGRTNQRGGQVSKIVEQKFSKSVQYIFAQKWSKWQQLGFSYVGNFVS